MKTIKTLTLASAAISGLMIAASSPAQAVGPNSPTMAYLSCNQTGSTTAYEYSAALGINAGIAFVVAPATPSLPSMSAAPGSGTLQSNTAAIKEALRNICRGDAAKRCAEFGQKAPDKVRILGDGTLFSAYGETRDCKPVSAVAQ